MGNKFSASKQSKELISSKVDISRKTGVLNLSDLKLTLKSDVWAKIDPEVIKLIDVSGNPLKKLPDKIYSMPSLKKLKCSRCELDGIFTAIRNNTILTHIDADHNVLEIDVVGSFPISLQQLNLSYNILSAIPPSILSLVNLVTLDLSSNRIVSLDGVAELTALTDLNVDNNEIVEIPSELALVPKLKRVSIRRNKIGVSAKSFPGQSIHADVLAKSFIDSMNLEGNIITKADIIKFDGVSAFIERRRKQKDKTLLMGATTEFDLFGLD